MSNLSNVPETVGTTSQPFNLSTFRQKLLDAAGFKEPEQVKLLVKVIASAEQALEATKETPLSKDGVLVDVHVQPDHQARAKARDQIIDLVGVNAPTRSVNERIQPPSIPLAPWMKTITVTNTAPSTEPPQIEAPQNTLTPHIDETAQTDTER